MKRLIIICEGPTELEFCREILYSHFFHQGILIETPLIKKSHGGCVAWSLIGKDIRLYLLSDPTAYVTTFIDLYGLHRPQEYPGWAEGLRETNVYNQIAILEGAIAQAIPEEHRHRLIPNFIVHEFEGLLFIDINVFDELFEGADFKSRAALEEVFARFPNPELINNNPVTAPSKRLQNNILTSFSKTITGIQIAKHTGLAAMRSKCPHFNEWITRLENL